MFTPDFVRIVVAHTLSSLGWSSMLLLPVYLDHIGANRARIGESMGSAAIAGLLVRPLVGVGLDRWGRKKVIAVGGCLQALAMVLVWWIDRPDGVAWASRVAFGLGAAAAFTGYFTLVTDLVPPTRRTEGIALFGISGLLPLWINPLLTRVGVSAEEVRWVVPIAASAVLCSLWPLSRIRERPRTAADALPPLRTLARALGRRPLWSAWLATFAFAALVVLFQAFATVTAAARGLPIPTDVWLTYGGGAVAIRLVGAKLPDRVGTHNLVAPAMAVLAFGALALAAAESHSGLLLAGLLGGIGHGLGFPVLTSQVASRCPAAVRGSALSVFTGLWDVAFLVAPAALGRLADAHSDAAMLAAAAALAALALLIWAGLEARYGGRAALPRSAG